jgi:hypothetical protein
VTIGVEDGMTWIRDSQLLASGLTVNVVVVAAVFLEVRRLVDKYSGLGVGTYVGGSPEGTAKVDLSGVVGILSRHLSVTGQLPHD